MKIYQVNPERDGSGIFNRPFEEAKARGINELSYDLIFEGQLNGVDDVVDTSNERLLGWVLEIVLCYCGIFDTRRLERYKGRKLSTSDVVVLNGVDGQAHAYYYTAPSTFSEISFG